MPVTRESLPDYAYGDTFLAACLAQAHGEDLRFCDELGGWFHWKGTHWQRDTKKYVFELARQTLTAVGEIALGRRQKDLLSFVAKSFNHTRVQNMLKEAATFPDLAVDPDIFDTDPWVLNCQNGTVDLRFGLIDVTKPHRREDYITRCLHIPYHTEASCPVWQRFLWRVMGGPGPNEDGLEDALLERHERASRLVGFLQRAVGYALTGRTDEQCLFILYGTGRNGKSRFLEACHDLLGPYAKAASMNTFLHQERETVRNDLADLQGVRLVTAIEANAGQRFSEGLLKQLTGGDRVKARFLFREYFEFLPNFKLFLAFNHKPTIKGGDLAMWERIHMIPFDVYIPPQERDHFLQEKLHDELPGILAWAVEGCLAWQVGEEGAPSGLIPPDEVRQATAEYQREMDLLGGFVGERCVKQGSEDGRLLYEAYQRWCAEEDQDPVAARTFGVDLQSKGYKRLKTNGKVLYTGIKLKYLS